MGTWDTQIINIERKIKNESESEDIYFWTTLVTHQIMAACDLIELEPSLFLFIS